MSRPLNPEEIECATRALVTARQTNIGVEITTPVMYPDGQCITVVATARDHGYLVHDAGFGAMNLASAGLRLTRGLSKKFADLAAAYGCEFVDGRMERYCSADQVAVAAVLVANASRTVGDEALAIHRSVVETVS